MRTPRNDRVSVSPEGKDAAPERTCVLTRRAAPKDALIRLALSPDGEVAPDVRARAPGRGAYIGVGRVELDAAIAKGKLKGALTRAFKHEVRIPSDLSDRIVAALRRAALDRLGLESRSGTLVTGGDRIEQAARGGRVRMLIHAGDAGEDGCKKLDQSWRVGGGPSTSSAKSAKGLVFPEDRTILSMALGRENVVHVALTDPAAARRVSNAIQRWLTFIDPDAGLQGGATDRGAGTIDDDDEGIK